MLVARTLISPEVKREIANRAINEDRSSIFLHEEKADSRRHESQTET